jgi:flagellar motility protein MotE (MotC chaperone)
LEKQTRDDAETMDDLDADVCNLLRVNKELRASLALATDELDKSTKHIKGLDNRIAYLDERRRAHLTEAQEAHKTILRLIGDSEAAIASRDLKIRKLKKKNKKTKGVLSLAQRGYFK